MNKPGFKTFVLGHPIVMVVATLGTGFGIYRWTQDSTSWPLTAIFLAGLGAATNASDRVAEYRRWKAAWDEMEGTPPARHPRWLHWLAALFGAAIGLAAVAYLPRLQRPVIVYWLAAIIGLFVLWRLFRRIRRGRHARKTATADPVAICVPSSSLPVPSLRQAYAALPTHCVSILRQKVL